MNLPLNQNLPTVMHVDLNSCFATAEQQAYPVLRGKPLVIAAYTTPSGCVVAPSIEAKRYGIKTGMNVREARLLCRDVIVRDPDPELIRNVHLKFRHVLQSFSPNFSPKSIDELVIDFTGTLGFKRGLITIGQEIKQKIRQEVGEWISVNIGISTNRFLSKLAASLHKPDGLDVVTHENLRGVYGSVKLTDLNGINTRFEARLNACGIFTPLDFLDASLDTLQHQVFKSICGYYWYLRLRGWEIDAVDFSRKSYGQSYALPVPTDDIKMLSPMMMKLCEKMGRRLRRAEFMAYGVHVSCLYTDGTHWNMGRTFHTPLYATRDLYVKAIWVFNQQPVKGKITHLSISCFHLAPTRPEQLDLFYDQDSRKKDLIDAVDKINDRYGEFVITPALMLGMDKLIIDRIAFGGVKELEDLYAT